MASIPDPSPLPGRMPRLDGLRALAILLVLFHQFDRTGDVSNPAALAIELVFERGWVGVQLFFVLSGFLITGILRDTRGRQGAYRDFLIGRTLRIFPLYFGTLAVLTVLLPALGLVPADYPHHAIWYWLFVANWTQDVVGGQLPHFWSLAVEEQFYLLWPLAALTLPTPRFLRLCGGVMVAALLARLAMRIAGIRPETIYMATFARMDALAAGAAVAAWMRTPGALEALRRRGREAWIAAGLLALAGFVATHGYERDTFLGQVVGYEVLSLVFALLVLLVASADAMGMGGWGTGWLRGKLLGRIGLYSFAMYVFHKPLHDLVGKPVLAYYGFPDKVPLAVDLIYTAFAMLATFAAAALSWHLYERRFLALRARRRRPQAGAPPG